MSELRSQIVSDAQSRQYTKYIITTTFQVPNHNAFIGNFLCPSFHLQQAVLCKYINSLSPCTIVQLYHEIGIDYPIHIGLKKETSN